jgi:hypothetical protein
LTKAIKEIDLPNIKVKLYPNPTENILYIEFSTLAAIESIGVYDHSGKKLLSQKRLTNSLTIEIDCRSLEKVIYFVEVVTNKGKLVRKFVKN